MPIFAGVAPETPTGPPVVEEVQGTPVLLPRAALPRTTFIWQPHEEEAIALSDPGSGLETPTGWSGFDMPPLEFTEEEGPWDGSEVTNIRLAPRDVFIPLTIRGKTWEELRERHQRVMNSLAPRNRYGTSVAPSPGLLSVVHPDGTKRTGKAFYKSGAEGVTGRGASGLWYRKIPLNFRYPDPLFYDPEEVLVSWAAGELPRDFFPILPVRLNSLSSSFGQPFPIGNAGPAEVWPLWEIHGPGAEISMVRMSDGAKLTIGGPFVDGEVVIVDTRPESPRVYSNKSGNKWGKKRGRFWSIPDGDSRIRIDYTGTLPGHEVILRYIPRYWTA